MKEKKIAAVVVTHNRRELLKENIEVLFAQTYSPLDILVVDNHSTDGTAEFLKEVEADPHQWGEKGFFAESLSENAGGAGGFYHGMKRAFDTGYDAVWIMDDDTIPERTALTELVLAAERAGGMETVGYLASEVLWTDGTACLMNRCRIAGEEREGLFPITQGSFVSLLIPAETIRTAGFPDPAYFIWGDDKEYTLRVSDERPCYLVKKSRVIHKTKTNSGSSIATDEPDRIDRYFYAYRNDYVTAKKRGKKDLLLYHAAYILNYLRVIAYGDEKKKRLKVMREGKQAGRKLCEQRIHS